jgi:Surface antigen variable number repeat
MKSVLRSRTVPTRQTERSSYFVWLKGRSFAGSSTREFDRSPGAPFSRRSTRTTFGLRWKSYFDQAQLSHAAVVIKELLAAHGYPSASVKPSYVRIPRTNAVTIVFNVDEGPKAKGL